MELSRLEAEAIQVAHAMDMVAELPPLTADEALPVAARVACVEAFFTNVRLLTEFIVLNPEKGRIHRYDYLPGWDPPPCGPVDDLRKHYGFVSEHVSHLMRKRVEPDRGAVDYVSVDELRRVAALVLDQLDAFAEALSNVQSPHAEMFLGFVSSARYRSRENL